MIIKPKPYDYQNRFGDDYHQVISFLKRLDRLDPYARYLHWGRFAWWISRPLDDEDIKKTHTLWVVDGMVVGISFFEMDPRYQLIALDPLYADERINILSHIITQHQDLDEMYLTIPNGDQQYQEQAQACGFSPTDDRETVLRMPVFTKPEPHPSLKLVDLDHGWDIKKYNRVMWKGFNHPGEPEATIEDLAWRQTMLSSPDIDPSLVIALEDDEGAFVAHTGIWYAPGTDKAYVEPLVTIPDYRQKGIGKLCLHTALHRAHLKGAKEAIVLSSQAFYLRSGFQECMEATFWKRTSNTK